MYFEQLSDLKQKLNNQFDNKYSFQSVLIACIELIGGPPNNSKKKSNKYIKIKTNDFRANQYSLMTCNHNQDEILKFQQKCF